MTARSLRRGIAFCSIALTVVSAARTSAEDATIKQILENPWRYNDESVVVKGTVTNLKPARSRRGDQYYTFDLSDGSRIMTVIMAGQPACASDTPVTVYGRVEVRRHSSKASGIVEASRIECR